MAPDWHWLDRPRHLLDGYNRRRATSHLFAVLKTAHRLRDEIDRVVVVGTAADLAAAQALVGACADPCFNDLDRGGRGSRPRIHFLTDQLDNDTLQALLRLLGEGRPATTLAQRWALVAVLPRHPNLAAALAIRHLLAALWQSAGGDPSQVASRFIPLGGPPTCPSASMPSGSMPSGSMPSGLASTVAHATKFVPPASHPPPAPFTIADQPTADDPAAAHPAADHPTADHPTADHPAADHPAADHPIVAWEQGWAGNATQWAARLGCVDAFPANPGEPSGPLNALAAPALLPAALLGIDIVRLLTGAVAFNDQFLTAPLGANPALDFATTALVLADEPTDAYADINPDLNADLNANLNADIPAALGTGKHRAGEAPNWSIATNAAATNAAATNASATNASATNASATNASATNASATGATATGATARATGGVATGGVASRARNADPPRRPCTLWAQALEQPGRWWETLFAASRRCAFVTHIMTDEWRSDPLAAVASDFPDPTPVSLSNRTLPELMLNAADRAVAADRLAGRVTAIVRLPRVDEWSLGQFFQMMMIATTIEQRVLASWPGTAPAPSTEGAEPTGAARRTA